jgi:flavin reductase (DIM6/NTAB) family NADH-FMN oxidoreductase RutF
MTETASADDVLALRRCFGQFATGVTIITTRRADGSSHGVTVNSFASVSLSPPLVLFSIDRRARSCDYLTEGPFVVNILADAQLALARHFAGQTGPPAAIAWAERRSCPVISGCTAYIWCRPWAVYEGGDHLIHVGEIDDLESCDGVPLIFHAGEFRRLGEHVGELSWKDMLTWAAGTGWLG